MSSSTSHKSSLPTSKKGLIITSGDASDPDGMLAMNLYYMAGLRHELDVIYVINYPQYYASKNTEAKDPPERLENMDTKVFIQDFWNKHNRKEIGLGYDYNYNDFCIAKNYRDKSGVLTNHKLSHIETYLRGDYSTVHQGLFIMEDDTLKHLQPSEITSYHIDKLLLTILVKTQLDCIWETCLQKYGIGPQLHFCIGKSHSTNPFSCIAVKHEVELYSDMLFEEYEFNLHKISFSLHGISHLQEVLESYTLGDIFIDMNGSVAWYADEVAQHLQKISFRIRAIMVMGGVLNTEAPNTLPANAFLNRLTCSTMNQLYHPQRSTQFLSDFSSKLFFVTNNEIKDNFSFTTSNDNVSYEEYLSMIQKCNLLSENPSNFMLKIFTKYYQPNERGRKLFDIISSLALVEFIEFHNHAAVNTLQVPDLLNLLIDDMYGITLFGKEKDAKGILKAYIHDGIRDGGKKEISDEQSNEINDVLSPLTMDSTSAIGSHLIVLDKVKCLFGCDDAKGRNAKTVYLADITSYLHENGATKGKQVVWNKWSFRSVSPSTASRCVCC